MSADRQTPETDAECFVNDGDLVPVDFARRLERERDEAMELCDFNAKQLLVAINERNSLVVQRDRLMEALKVVLEDWKAGYRPEESGKSFDMARAAIAEVEGSR